MRFVALMRGINVGGKAVAGMAALRNELETIGLGSVRTHLNSGNALFSSDLPEEALEEMIEQALEARFGFRIPTLVRSAEALRAVVEGLPFPADQIARAEAAADDAASLYAAFLSAEPSPEARGRIDALVRPGETVRVSGRTIYLLLEHSIRECRLFAALARLDGRATTRNWNTVLKLDALLGA